MIKCSPARWRPESGPPRSGPHSYQPRYRGSRASPARVLCRRAPRRGQHFPGLYRRLVRQLRRSWYAPAEAADADDGALRNAALLSWPGSPSRPFGITYGAARLTAGRILRPSSPSSPRPPSTSPRPATSPPASDSTGTSDEVEIASSPRPLTPCWPRCSPRITHRATPARRRTRHYELRTPLTSLTTNLDLLEDGAGLADPQAPALVRTAAREAGGRAEPA